MSAHKKPTVAALLLAAGTSSRAGPSNKLLHIYTGLPLLTHIARQLELSSIDHTLAVTGFDRSNVESVLNAEGIDCTYNQDYALGMASSLACGIAKLIEVDAVIVCLADMPHVNAPIINALIDAFTTQPDKSLFVPSFQGARGNPVLIAQEFFTLLLSHQGDSGARFLQTQFPDSLVDVPVDSAAILHDYDTQAELDRLKNSGLPG